MKPNKLYIRFASTSKSSGMTEKEREENLKAIKKVGDKLKGDKEASRKFLQKVGIITKSGKLTKAYGG